MSDGWEVDNGLNPNDGSDAALDPDGDWLTNLEEYEISTDPDNYFSPCVIKVDYNGSGDYTTIQEGIDNAINGDTVLVYPGTYFENINYNGKNITIGSLYLTTQNNCYIDSTIIDGNQNGSVVTFESGEDTTAILCGFTIQKRERNSTGEF